MALKNLEQHVLTQDFAPSIAQVRGHVGITQAAEQSKQEAKDYFEKLLKFAETSVPPSDSIRRQIHELRERLRSE
ncbi:hypothetical protein D3C76_1766320 [compost metagenome]